MADIEEKEVADEQVEEDPEPKQLLIEWGGVDNLPILYATNMVIQHTSSEFIINLYQLLPPTVWGTDAQRRAAFKAITAVQAYPLARVVVSADRMAGFVKALQSSLAKYEKQFGSFEELEEIDEEPSEEETP